MRRPCDFLDYALVGNIAALGVGRARYTMICRPDGGILDDLIVYRLGESEYLVVANASNAQTVLDALIERPRASTPRYATTATRTR